LTGTNFKCAACAITGVMLFLEIQHGKEGMLSELNRYCTIRICERCAQARGVKADACFGSVLTCVELNHPWF